MILNLRNGHSIADLFRRAFPSQSTSIFKASVVFDFEKVSTALELMDKTSKHVF